MGYLKYLLVLIAIIPTLVFADDIAKPNDIVVSQPFVFPDVIQAGDFLIVAKYDIQYTTIPDLNTEQAFVIRLFNNSIERASKVPFVRDNSGYELSIVSFYFSAAQASEVFIEPDDNLQISVEGSPLVFSDPPKVSRIAQWRSPGDLCGVTLLFFCSSIVDQLKTYIITTSSDLKADWGVEILESTERGSGTVFTPTGDNYFTTTIPQLRTIVPDFFSETVRTPEIDTPEFTNAEQLDRESFLDNTSIDTFFQVVFEDTFNIPKTLAMTVVLILVGITISTGMKIFVQQEIASFIGFIVVITAGAYIGMTLIQFLTLLGATGAVMIVWTLFFKRTD